MKQNSARPSRHPQPCGLNPCPRRGRPPSRQRPLRRSPAGGLSSPASPALAFQRPSPESASGALTFPQISGGGASPSAPSGSLLHAPFHTPAGSLPRLLPSVVCSPTPRPPRSSTPSGWSGPSGTGTEPGEPWKRGEAPESQVPPGGTWAAREGTPTGWLLEGAGLAESGRRPDPGLIPRPVILESRASCLSGPRTPHGQRGPEVTSVGLQYLV